MHYSFKMIWAKDFIIVFFSSYMSHIKDQNAKNVSVEIKKRNNERIKKEKSQQQYLPLTKIHKYERKCQSLATVSYS